MEACEDLRMWVAMSGEISQRRTAVWPHGVSAKAPEETWREMPAESGVSCQAGAGSEAWTLEACSESRKHYGWALSLVSNSGAAPAAFHTWA